MKKSVDLLFMTLGLSSQAFATDLMDIYHQALENDTIFKNAYDTYMANAEALPQARAALYPQVGLLAGQTGQYLTRRITRFYCQLQSYYNSNVCGKLPHPRLFLIIKPGLKVAQAKASVKAAQATFNDAAQDLILRTAKAYFDVLLCQRYLKFC